MEEIKFYKADYLPSPLTPADDGIYFVKAPTDTAYTSYIVSNGQLTDQKIALDDVIPYIGAKKPIDINLQDFITNGRLLKGPSHFEIKDFGGNNVANQYIHKLTDVAHAVTSGTVAPWVITLPLRGGNPQWLMDLDISENGYSIKLLISAQGILNNQPLVSVIQGGNRITSVAFGKDASSNTCIVINLANTSTGLRYATINSFSHAGTYFSDISIKNNFKVEAKVISSIPGWSQTLLYPNSAFDRDTYYLNYDNLYNKPTIVNNYVSNINLANGTTNGPVYTFQRAGLSDLSMTIPVASSTFAGVVNVGAQQFSGPKTFLDPVTIPNAINNSHSVALGQVVGAVVDVLFNTTTQIFTFKRLNAPDINVDLDIEALIQNIDVINDELVITFQDGTTKSIPLNQLLVGVVKSVNGVLPNSTGNVSLAISDIPGLVAALAGKFDIPSGTTLQYVRGDGSLATLPTYNIGSGVLTMAGSADFSLSNNPTFGANDTANKTITYSLSTVVKADIAEGKTAFSWGDHAAGGYLKTVSWAIITGKPTSFPPSAHTHVIADVTGLPQALADKSNVGHTHNWADINNPPTSFPPGPHQHPWSDITNKPTTFPPSAHSHVIADVTGLTSALAGKSDVGHTHAWVDITGKPATFTPSAHTHVIADVTGLGQALAGKSNVGHTHDWVDITNKPTVFNPAAHTHPTSEVTSLAGYVIGSNTPLAAQDTLNAALGKLQAQINSKTNNVGTVTSIGMSIAGNAINVSPASITTAGTFNITFGGLAGHYINGLGNLVAFPAIPVVNNGQLNIAVSNEFNTSSAGTFTANQSANTNISLALSSTTRSQIDQGVIAYGWGRGLRVDGNGAFNGGGTIAGSIDVVRNASMYASSSASGKPNGIAGDVTIVNFTSGSSVINGTQRYSGFDLVSSATTNQMWFRRENLDNLKSDWYEFLHTGNIGSYVGSMDLQAITDNGYDTTNPIVAERLVSRGEIVANADDSVYKGLRYETNGNIRWYLYTQPGAEGGNNSGSNLFLARYADDGSYIDNVFNIIRATGEVTFNNLNTISHGSSWHWHQAYLATQTMTTDYVSRVNNQSVGGIKKFTGSYTEWLLGDNGNNACGFAQSLPGEFLLGSLNDKNVSLYRNSVPKMTLHNDRTSFVNYVQAPQFLADGGGVRIYGTGGVNANTTKIFFENPFASIGWAISQGVNNSSQENIHIGTWDGATFVNKFSFTNDGHFYTLEGGNSQNWLHAYHKSISNFIPLSNTAYGNGFRINHLDGDLKEAWHAGIRILDVRNTVAAPNSGGVSNYIPNSGESQLYYNLTPLFHEGWGGNGWGSSIIMKGWNTNYRAWMISGPADTLDEEDDIYIRQSVSSTGNWLSPRKIWTSKHFSDAHIANWNQAYANMSNLGNKVDKSGDTMTGSINFGGNNIGLYFNGWKALEAYNNNTILSSNGDTIYFRPNGSNSSVGSAYLEPNGKFQTDSHGSSEDWFRASQVTRGSMKYRLTSGDETGTGFYRVKLANLGFVGIVKIMLTGSFWNANVNGYIEVTGGVGSNVNGIWNQQLKCIASIGYTREYYIDYEVKQDIPNGYFYINIHKKSSALNPLFVHIELMTTGGNVYDIGTPEIMNFTAGTPLALTNEVQLWGLMGSDGDKIVTVDNEGQLKRTTTSISNFTWEQTLLNNPVATSLPIFQRGSGTKFVLKDHAGGLQENYFSWQRSDNSERAYMGFGSNGNNHFTFYLDGAGTKYQWNIGGQWAKEITVNRINHYLVTDLYRDLNMMNGTWLYANNSNSNEWTQAFKWGDHRTYGDLGHQQYLGGNYVGGGNEKPNYFGAGKLKLQMLQADGTNIPGDPTWGWSDVLWMSSYSGTDVKLSTAIVSSKYANKIGFTKQHFDDPNWGQLYEFWHSGNLPASAVNQISNALIGSTSAATAQNFSFAIGTDPSSQRNFIQAHNGRPLDLNPLGNAVTIQNELISAPLIQSWNAKFTLPGGGNAGHYINGLGQLAVLPGSTSYSGSASIILAGGNSFQRAALTGDVTAAQNSNATTISAGAVTFNKMQNINQGVLLGRRAGVGVGDVEEIYLGTGLAWNGQYIQVQSGGSGITRIHTDMENLESDPPVTGSDIYFHSYAEGGGVPYVTSREVFGNLHIVSTGSGDRLYMFGSYDNTALVRINTGGGAQYIDLHEIRKHIVTVHAVTAGTIDVDFPDGIWAGDQINVLSMGSAGIVVRSNKIITPGGASSAFECRTFCCLIWNSEENGWVLTSYNP